MIHIKDPINAVKTAILAEEETMSYLHLTVILNTDQKDYDVYSFSSQEATGLGFLIDNRNVEVGLKDIKTIYNKVFQIEENVANIYFILNNIEKIIEMRE